MTEGEPIGRRETARGVLMLGLAGLAAACLTASAYWPGLMSWDPVRQYGEASSGAITDWHPPVMAWLWRQLMRVASGPLPMLLLQLVLYWGGMVVLASAIWSRGRRGLAWALLACGLWPVAIALTGAILKDCLMTGALLAATGLLAWRKEHGGVGWRIIAGALLVFAAMLRFNAFTACLPLLVALLPRSWWQSWPRLVATSVGAGALLIAAMPAVNRAIGAEPSGVALSLVIFDLGGITEHAGTSVFPEELEVRDPVRVNHGCYRPNKWDSYSDWVEPECPLGFSAWNDNVDPAEVSANAVLVHAIVAHPIAYAEHRLHHFAINTRLLPLADAIERPVPISSAPNPWGFTLVPNVATRTIDRMAVASAHTPLGWPIVFIGLALGVAVASRGSPGTRLIMPIALSSLAYGSGYLVFSVAAELRYHLWTAIGALLAAVLLIGELHATAPRRLLWAFMPAALAAIAGVIARCLVG